MGFVQVENNEYVELKNSFYTHANLAKFQKRLCIY